MVKPVHVVVVAVWLVVFLGLMGTGTQARHGALVSLTVVSSLLLLVTEVLSLFHALESTWLAIVWLVALCAALLVTRGTLAAGVSAVRDRLRLQLSRSDWLFGATVLLFGLGTLAAALLYPVMNWDSLAYHMPRVHFWLQNGSVEAYPTPEGRQLFSGVFASYLVAQLKALSGGSDRLVNLVQWKSYVFSLVGVSLIAKQLGAGRHGQQAAVLVAASTPMALLQASTTQTDLTSALWCIATAYFALAYVTREPTGGGSRFAWAALTGASVGLAVQSKPTAYMYCLPIALWLAIAVVRREGWRRASSIAAVGLACLLALSMGTYIRNASLLRGDFLALHAPSNAVTVLRDRSLASIATNVRMNGSMILGTPIPRVNRAVERAVSVFSAWWGGDTANAQVQKLGAGPFALPRSVTHHDVAPAPITAILIGLSAAVILATRARQKPVTVAYIGCVLVAFTLAAALVAWQPWINRLLLPPVLLGAPLVGVTATILRADGRRFAAGVLVGLMGIAVMWGAGALLFHSTNKLVSAELVPGRPFGMNVGYWSTPYDELQLCVQAADVRAATEAVCEASARHGLRRIGVIQRTGEFKIYPLLVRCPGVEFGYVERTVLPDRIVDPDFVPEAMLEVVPVADYPRMLDDGRRRGARLMEPQAAGDAVVLLYDIP